MTAQNRRYDVLLAEPFYRASLVEISAPGPAEAAEQAVSRYNSDPEFRDDVDSGWEELDAMDPPGVFADWVFDTETGENIPAPAPDISAELYAACAYLNLDRQDHHHSTQRWSLDPGKLRAALEHANLKITKA